MRFSSRPAEPVPEPLSLEPDHVWISPTVSLWGWGEAARFNPGAEPDRIDTLRAQYSAFLAGVESDGGAPVPGPVLFSSTTFAPGSPGSVGVIPTLLLGRSGTDWWLTSSTGDFDLPPTGKTAPAPDRPRYAGSSAPDMIWLEAVAKAIQRIHQGQLEKVVLARDYAVWSRTPFYPPRLLGHLSNRFPGCYVFRVGGMVGASPELLARRTGSLFQSQVLAGSVPAHSDPAADQEAARRLLSSDKDKWEHELAVRSVEESLAGMGLAATIGTPELLRLDNVQHLATDVAATVPGHFDALRLAAALHPTAAVGGTPTEAATAAISELEGMNRGHYAGPIGWMAPGGDGELAIALRCAELSGARARLFAGAGIVRGSLPEAELEETRVKLAAMMGALGAGQPA